jgi:peptidoglycan biosynthesis protein MviN/MurJ (putative lipid II flippase)
MLVVVVVVVVWAERRLLLPGLWFYMMADVLRRWLQSQAIVKPVIYIAICGVLINVRLDPSSPSLLSSSSMS